MPQWLDCWVHIPEAVLEIPDGCCICHGNRRLAADVWVEGTLPAFRVQCWPLQ